MNCQDCTFSNLAFAGDDPVLECRRFPMQLFMTPDGATQSWPHVAADDWCGEFQKDEIVR